MSNLNNEDNFSDNDFVGLKKEDAFKLCEQRGLRHRVTSENGKSFIITMDYRLGRVNFHIDNNIVLSTSRG